MTVLPVNSSWIDFPMLLFCNFKNSGHGGFAVKIFGFAVRSSLLGLPGNDIRRQRKIFQFLKVSGLAFIKQSDPTVPDLAGWIPSLVELGTLVCTMSSTITLVATEESTRTSALELEPP